MTVTAIIVGLNEWERYTLPCIMSIQAVDPMLNIVCVDNGSVPEYPVTPGVLMTRTPSKRSYAGGINWGMKQAPDSDWYVVLNNDILVNKPLSERIEKLDPKRFYGFCLYGPQPALFTWEYMPSWCYFYHKELWDKVGEFDEKCAPMYFEDADYCKRVQKAGYKMQVEDRVDWGILHLEGERHKERRAYMKQHMPERNSIRLYVRAKHAK
jgi:GT2 family glycosyltransferase